MQKLSRVKMVKYANWGDLPIMVSNPALGAGVAQCIAAWSEIETLLGMFLGIILHANQSAALAMYSTVENRSAQLRMIEVAAHSNLSALQSDLISVILSKIIRPAMKQRDKLAHWTWGYSEELPGSLLIRDPSISLKDYVSVVKSGSPVDIPSNYDDIFVIRGVDLDKYIARFREVNLIIRTAIASILETNSQKERDQYLLQLLNMPEIQTGLDHLHAGRQKNQAARPQEPPLTDGAGI